MKNHIYISFSPFYSKIKSITGIIMMFIYKTAKITRVRTNILEILEILYIAR